MKDSATSFDHLTLIAAPTGRDAENICEVLASTAIKAAICRSPAEMAVRLESGCGAIVLTEEALAADTTGALAGALQRQPSWSDIPVVLIVSGGHRALANEEVQRLIRPRTNFVLVERPLGRETLVSTVQAALRARSRQYEVRDLLAERDELLATLEQRVAERTARLQEANAELEAFSYSVSHDLRAPLRSLETYAKILSDEHSSGLSEEARHYLRRIVRNAEKMDRLMQDVLTFSRIARSEMHLEPIDLDGVIDDVIEQYPDVAAARRRITIATPLGVVLAHGPSLVQCFSNLLQNALKFVPPDRTPEIRVYSEPAGARLRVNVHDNGIGIAPAYQTRIFGIFERASPASVPGTGIGLAIVKKAVERMGGTVGVQSAPDQGARFWIELEIAGSLEPSGRADTPSAATA